MAFQRGITHRLKSGRQTVIGTTFDREKPFEMLATPFARDFESFILRLRPDGPEEMAANENIPGFHVRPLEWSSVAVFGAWGTRMIAGIRQETPTAQPRGAERR